MLKEEIPVYFENKDAIKEFEFITRRINFFGKKIPLYDLLMGYWERKSDRDLISFIPKVRSKKIIELGVGTGYLLCKIAKKFPDSNITAVDLSVKMLEYSDKYLKRKGFNGDNIRFVVEDCRKLSKRNKFDLIFSSYLLDLMSQKDIVKSLKNIYQILSNDGRAYILVMDSMSDRKKFKFSYVYFRIMNFIYKVYYKNRTLKRASHAIFKYYTHCRPINLDMYLGMAGLDKTKERESYISVLGFPLLPVKIIELRK